jgi:transcriptional regulator with XRE-family HTH domain
MSVKEFGQKVRNMRGKMSQDEVGFKIEVSGSTVGSYERGKFYPTGDVIIKICELFGCSADYLLGLSEESKPVRGKAPKAEPLPVRNQMSFEEAALRTENNELQADNARLKSQIHSLAVERDNLRLIVSGTEALSKNLDEADRTIQDLKGTIIAERSKAIEAKSESEALHGLLTQICEIAMKGVE